MHPLFVYGTLRPGSGHPNAARLLREADHLGPACVAGRLWRVSTYPGLTRGGGTVQGDLLRLRDRASLVWLDTYEMCGPDDPLPHPYARATVPVRWRGRTISASTYLWVAPTVGLGLVCNGDWLSSHSRSSGRAVHRRVSTQ